MHPGGESVILQFGGKDATEEFDLIHSLDVIEQFLSSDMCIGEVEPVKATAEFNNMGNNRKQKQSSRVITSGSYKENHKPYTLDTMPPIEEIQNAFDFECELLLQKERITTFHIYKTYSSSGHLIFSPCKTSFKTERILIFFIGLRR